MKFVAWATLVLPVLSWADCVPNALWSGKLVAPEVSERHTDGGVEIDLENTPERHAALRGKRVRLVPEGPLSKIRHDVTFGPKALHWIQKDQLIVARGLDGWKNVSPLESLSHSRPNDDIRVSLNVLSVNTNGSLRIADEPVLLDGNKRCLVKFLSVDGDETLVRHHNGHEERMKLDFKRALPISPDQVVELRGIESHAINETGWDIFGHKVNGTFVIESIEPYALHKVKDSSRAQKFRSLKDYWKSDDSKKTTATQISYLSKNGVSSETFQAGEKFLLVHAFGSYNDQGTTLGKFRGHAGIGIAETVNHPITGELVYDVIYKQVYGQSKQGVFAASYHGHAYTGNLYRGRAFVRPMNDILYPMKGMGEGFQERLEKAFDEMAIGYRAGFGHGMARVTLMTSCVHDTGNVLIDVLNASPKTPLLTKMSRSIGRAVKPDDKFRNVELLPDGIDTEISTLLNGRKNLNLTIPRNFQDSLLKAFTKDGEHPVVILQTMQVGDDLPGISPKAPDRINTLTGTLIQHWMNQIF